MGGLQIAMRPDVLAPVITTSLLLTASACAWDSGASLGHRTSASTLMSSTQRMSDQEDIGELLAGANGASFALKPALGDCP
jgi:hypothetical protein